MSSAISALPISVLSNSIFAYLLLPELLNCGRVCKSWKEATDQDACWLQQCKVLWRGKASMPFSYPGCKLEHLFARIRLSSACINSLSLRELKNLLYYRHVNYSGYLEKGEYRRAVIESSPPDVLGWSMKYDSKWKASCVYSLLDSKRRNITKEELVGNDWMMFFKARGFMAEIKFQEDGSLITSFQNKHYWKFTSDANQNGERCKYIQVDQYPKLVVSRLKDWSWKLENEMVEIKSQHYGI